MAIIRCVDKQGSMFTVSPEALASGFMERGTYYFEIVPESRLFVDDEPWESSRHEAFDAWRWEPGFYAGKVVAELALAGQTSTDISAFSVNRFSR